ncbi:MAG: small multi-drug export protein, partial [Oscillospiraceae bacterium]|nr:small multi-drug export protein [Oscillospiraceae bacterium]
MLKSLLLCALLSITPVSELRGAIPFGLSQDIPAVLLFLVCVCANLLPVPFILLFLRKVLTWMQGRKGWMENTANWLITRGESKSELYRKYEQLGLFILVAIPLPGTGAWTGALVAGLLGLRIKKALPPIVLGVVAAGIVVLLVSQGVIHIAG